MRQEEGERKRYAKRTTVQEKSKSDVCWKTKGEDEHADRCLI